MAMNIFVLWENNFFRVSTPKNPHIPYTEGLHVIVAPKEEVPNAWTDIELSAVTFRLASQVCQIMEKIQFAPWFNIQANGNWGLLAGEKPSFHVHVYGRNKTSMWGKPILLPTAPKTYKNEPMPESDRDVLIKEFKSSLIEYGI
jgi:diadenosine tetraphosphate (Ap4A) HIT family hydrolase